MWHIVKDVREAYRVHLTTSPIRDPSIMGLWTDASGACCLPRTVLMKRLVVESFFSPLIGLTVQPKTLTMRSQIASRSLSSSRHIRSILIKRTGTTSLTSQIGRRLTTCDNGFHDATQTDKSSPSNSGKTSSTSTSLDPSATSRAVTLSTAMSSGVTSLTSSSTLSDTMSRPSSLINGRKAPQDRTTVRSAQMGSAERGWSAGELTALMCWDGDQAKLDAPSY